MAVGALKALKSIAEYLRRPEISRIPVTGCDGVPDFGQQLVTTGRLAATIVVPSTGAPAVNLIADALGTGKQPPAQIVLPPRSFPDEETLAARFAKP
jgi:ABC-type sugar transport system substrate-binding protein